MVAIQSVQMDVAVHTAKPVKLLVVLLMPDPVLTLSVQSTGKREMSHFFRKQQTYL